MDSPALSAQACVVTGSIQTGKRKDIPPPLKRWELLPNHTTYTTGGDFPSMRVSVSPTNRFGNSSVFILYDSSPKPSLSKSMKLTKKPFCGFVPLFSKPNILRMSVGPSKPFLPFSFKTVPSLLRTVTFSFIQDLLVVHKFKLGLNSTETKPVKATRDLVNKGKYLV
jgi:hypothetical protein